MKPARHLSTTLVLCTFVGLFAPLANAAQDDLQLARDMKFARELATRYAYVDYAEEVLGELKARASGASATEALELLQCDILAAGASGAGNYEERRELLERALEAYQKFLKDNPRSALLSRAERGYVGMVNIFGRLLEARLPDALGDEATEIRSQLHDVLGTGLELTSTLLSQTANPTSPSEKNERYRLMIDLAQMYLTFGSVAEDGSYEFSRAEETLEQLVGEAGELSGYGLNGFILLGKVLSTQGKDAESTDYTGYVMDVVLPSSENREESGWDTLSYDDKLQRWKLAELCGKELIDACRASDNSAAAISWSLHFFNYLKSEGFPLSDLGNASLLAVASSLLDADGYVGGAINSGALAWFETSEEMSAAGHSTRNARSALELALSIAQDVNTAYQGKRVRLQVDAQKVISNIIQRPGVSVSPEILLQAAEGDYNNKEYPRAINSLKSILTELAKRDEATRRQYSPHALYYLGLSYARLGRHLEAAMAFREGVTTWKGDAEYDEQLARQYNASISRVAKSAGSEPRFKSMVEEAESILLSVADNTGNISFGQAERRFGKQDYKGARALYLQVEQGEPVYEKAHMKAALCLYQMQDLVNAQAEFKRFLEQYVTDPRNKPVDRIAQATRIESTSLATYYLGTMAFDAGNHAESLEYLADFNTQFATQESFCEVALSKVVQSYLALNDLKNAKLTFDEQKSTFPSSAYTGVSASRIYQAVNSMFDQAEKAGDAKLAAALKLEMATNRGIANELASTPSFNNLRAEAALWGDLKNWKRMESALRTVVSNFADDPDPSRDIKDRVLPDLGLALLEQKRLPEAYQVLDPLIDKDPDSEVRMSSSLTRRWALAVSGWVEGDKEKIIEVPGTGGAKDLAIAAEFFNKLTSAESEKWVTSWYQLKFETAYAYYIWSKEDSSKKETTFNLIENLQIVSGDDRLMDITKKSGDDVLRSRFLWLLGKVR